MSFLPRGTVVIYAHAQYHHTATWQFCYIRHCAAITDPSLLVPRRWMCNNYITLQHNSRAFCTSVLELGRHSHLTILGGILEYRVTDIVAFLICQRHICHPYFVYIVLISLLYMYIQSYGYWLVIMYKDNISYMY